MLYTKDINSIQEEGESLERFITSLYALVQIFKFPTSFQKEMIRDRIVCGIRDKKVSENQQLDMKLESIEERDYNSSAG